MEGRVANILALFGYNVKIKQGQIEMITARASRQQWELNHAHSCLAIESGLSASTKVLLASGADLLERTSRLYD